MPRYFKKKITIDELAENLMSVWEKTNDYKLDLEDQEEQEDNPIDYFQNGYHYVYWQDFTSQVNKDLSKIEFDCENISCNPDDAYTMRKDDAKEMVGFQTLENGLTYLGFTAGGDWELPVFFMIYHDGNKLRGYIPKDGNQYNKTHKTAYGNLGDEIDWADSKKHNGYDDPSLGDFDFKKMKKDILGRIKYKE